MMSSQTDELTRSIPGTDDESPLNDAAGSRGATSPHGLLVSQIGYDLEATKRALVRGPEGWLSGDAYFRITPGRDSIAAPVASAPVIDFEAVSNWGELWGSHWWVADFSALDSAGSYLLEIYDPQRDELHAGNDPEANSAEANAPIYSEVFGVKSGLLWAETWKDVSYEQAERRQRLAQNQLGWYDAGTHWQEANSHALYLLGLSDLLIHCAQELSSSEAERICKQLINGADYLAALQDLAASKGYGEGALVHQIFRYDDVVLPGDVAKASCAWAKVAQALPDGYADKKDQYRQRAQKSLRWLNSYSGYSTLPFNGLPHGLPAGAGLPAEPPTAHLCLMLNAAISIARIPDSDIDFATVLELAERVMARQVASPEGSSSRRASGVSQTETALYGHFQTFDSGVTLDEKADGDGQAGAPVTEKSQRVLTEKAWTHGFGPEGMGFNNGETFGNNIFPLIELLKNWPDHAEAPKWRQAVENYAYGYFKPACKSNPFGIVPNGIFGEEGLIWFAGLWHGATAIYGVAAALAFEFADLFDDDEFLDIAVGNMQWIAGLNSGITQESLSASHMWTTVVPVGVALPFSLINGIGKRFAGTWLNIRGSICNGFCTGDQFRYDVEPRAALDGPHTFTDEDWITHAGAWLMALSRSRRLT